MSFEIPRDELEKMKQNCLTWANNCGGCETCSQFFGNTPPYDHQETYYLICMIEAREKEIFKLKRWLMFAILLAFFIWVKF